MVDCECHSAVNPTHDLQTASESRFTQTSLVPLRFLWNVGSCARFIILNHFISWNFQECIQMSRLDMEGILKCKNLLLKTNKEYWKGYVLPRIIVVMYLHIFILNIPRFQLCWGCFFLATKMLRSIPLFFLRLWKCTTLNIFYKQNNTRVLFFLFIKWWSTTNITLR